MKKVNLILTATLCITTSMGFAASILPGSKVEISAVSQNGKHFTATSSNASIGFPSSVSSASGPYLFSLGGSITPNSQPVFITYTNSATHESCQFSIMPIITYPGAVTKLDINPNGTPSAFSCTVVDGTTPKLIITARSVTPNITPHIGS